MQEGCKNQISPLKERVIKYIDYKCIKRSSFLKKTGINHANFIGIGLKSELGGDKIIKILQEYPDLNTEWFLMGRGEMLKSKNEETFSDKISVSLLEMDRDCKIKMLKEIIKSKDQVIEVLNTRIKDLENKQNTSS